jgi:hypothetical protein
LEISQQMFACLPYHSLTDILCDYLHS